VNFFATAEIFATNSSMLLAMIQEHLLLRTAAVTVVLPSSVYYCVIR